MTLRHDKDLIMFWWHALTYKDTAELDRSYLNQIELVCNGGGTVKSLLQAHALLIEAHSPVWMGKIPIFQTNFPKKSRLIKAQPRILKKNWFYVMQKHLAFVISSKFLVVRLQQIVPQNKVHCFWPYFHLVGKYQPWLACCEPRTVLCPGQCIFKVLSIPSKEIRFIVSIVVYKQTSPH